MRAKLDLDPWGEVNTILGQALIYLLLTMELGGLRVEIHADPGSKLGSLPFPSATALSSLASPTTPDLPPFIISEEENDKED